MTDTDSPSAVSIPGSSHRRKTAYSVSLHDNTCDILEVPLTDDPVVSDEEGDNPSVKPSLKCPTCNQILPPKKHNELSRNSINSSTPVHQLSRSLPTKLGADTHARGNYQSITDLSGESSGNDGLEHCHGIRIAQPDVKARRRLIIASILCLLFMVAEIIGGYMANSLAIATDAAHLLTDFASFMISLFSLWVSTRPATKRMSFGWYRAEVIGALTSVLLIWVVTGVLVYLAIQRIVNKEFDIDAKIMLITSGIGVLVNLVMGCTLHQHGHSHSGHTHGHSHGGQIHANHNHANHTHDAESQPLLLGSHEHSQSEENINVRAAFIHVIGDFIQSLGVFVAALLIYFKPTWTIVDPICTFLFSVLVLLTTVAILKDALTVLMEGIPRGLDFNVVQDTFLSIEGVIRVHNLRIWALSMDKTALAAHLAVRPGVKTQEVLLRASQLVRSRFNVFEMTLQIEEFEAGMEDCTQCQDPLD